MSDAMGWRRLTDLVVVVLLTVGVVAGPAAADVRVENHQRTMLRSGADGLQVYAYGSGTDVTAEFASGTHDTTIEVSGGLEIDRSGALDDWWDTAWSHRQCHEVTSATTIPEMPVRLVVDTTATGSDGSDVRVVAATDGALLPLYAEGPFPSTASVVWFQAEPLAAGTSTYCVYTGNPTATTVSDETAPFTYGTGTTIRYATLTDRHQGNGVDSRVTVVSYVDDNVVSDGTTTVTLAAGGTHSFNGLTEDSIITATGPIDGSGDRDGRDTLVPEGYAASSFVFPTTRRTERFWVRSDSSTTIEAVSNGVVVASASITPADGAVAIGAPSSDPAPVVLRSTDGARFLAMHIGTDAQDALIGVPWTGDTIVGVPSGTLTIAAASSTTATWSASDGASASVTADPSTLTAVAFGSTEGAAPAVAVTGASAVAAAGQEDGTGSDSSAFLPRRLLNATYRIPIRSRYAAVACPEPGTTISVDGTVVGTCTGTSVGHLRIGTTLDAGAVVTGDRPFHLVYDSRSTRNETNILGAKGAIPDVATPSVSAGAVETSGACGSWRSGDLATSGSAVFGLVATGVDLPTGTSAEIQMAVDGSDPFGVDGTDATTLADGDIVPYLADGATAFELFVELCTDDVAVTPRVDLLRVETDLPELVPGIGAAPIVTLDSAATTAADPVLRVRQSVAGAWLTNVRYRSGSGLTDLQATVGTDHPTTQVTVTAGTVAAPSPSFPHDPSTPFSLLVDHATTAGATSILGIEIRAVDGIAAVVPIDLRFEG